jgi:hypothetical protein
MPQPRHKAVLPFVIRQEIKFREIIPGSSFLERRLVSHLINAAAARGERRQTSNESGGKK